MHYEGMIIRPPSEADSILLQVTLGCSHNRCTFCGTYKEKRFAIKSDAVIAADIAFAARHCGRQDRVFLCDGDALIIPFARLLSILRAIQTQLPWVKRVGAYANAKSIDLKTPEQLEQLRGHGLGILYLGMESGDDETLRQIRKGADSQKMAAMGQKARAAGLALSITVLVGIAGRRRSQIHAELRTMIAATNLSNGLFHANHASNYLPLRARLPKDKAATLALIDKALEGRIGLKPEFMRAL